MSPYLLKAHSLLTAHLLLLSYVVAHGGGHSSEEASAPSATHSRLKAKGLILVKIWCLIIAFVTTFLAGMSPYFYRWNTVFLVLGTQFSGGVFLTTALVHFLSDANASIKQHTSNPYPFAFVLATFGYLLTMLGDCIVSIISSRIQLKKLPTNPPHEEVGNNGTPSASIPSCRREDDEEALPAQKCDNKSSKAFKVKTVVPAVLVTKASVGDAALLILALCFHSVFEGIAIGAAETKHDAWRNLWTVCLHKVFAAIAMGIALLQILPSRPLLSCASYAFAFAASSPVGVAIGIIIDSTSEGAVADWVYSISMGIACGVFMYVAVNHLLAKKGHDNKSKALDACPLFKFMAVALGATVMAVVLIWD